MNHAMKNVIRFAGVVAGLAAAAWALRDRMLPDPQTPSADQPAFRHASSTETHDDLTNVKGIGPAYAERLAAAGLNSVEDLAAASAADVAEAAGTTDAVAERWIASAKELS
ncbi:MAG: helix-hairpin-helix domain-containing protein [Acidimicrobiia bacterium]|nr:helix-hairpin-helix domain-containing protein [Acidimicrobiia bacterium]